MCIRDSRITTNGNSTENNPPFILHFVDKVQPLLDILKSVVTDKDYYYQVMKGNKIKLQVNSLANYKLAVSYTHLERSDAYLLKFIKR